MKIVLLVCVNITLKDICHKPEIFSNALESITLKHFSLEVIPPSHRRPGVTAVLVRHKPQWHLHDRRGSAVVPSLIDVAPPKTVNTADVRGGTAETLNMFKTSAGWANPQWGRSGTAMTAVAPYKDRSRTSITAVRP